MCANIELFKMNDLVVDIEGQLRHCSCNEKLKIVSGIPYFDQDLKKILKNLEKEDNLALQKYVNELLEKRGPRRHSGKIDTVCFYQNCSISAASWSNFTYGKFSRETILKIIAGLECNLPETEQILKLAGYCLTNSRQDRLVKAAILSGHHNSGDMYEILEYYSAQYPREVKNYYKNED